MVRMTFAAFEFMQQSFDRQGQDAIAAGTAVALMDV
ncbi:hypothetical protein PF010_g32622 [Phytophthora fragariae]|uniref:Uncharacterized protein n=1 Tax=Phytophthora fragariae TaxID=53985 RepID=A0A6G0JEG3_9STRA|nr:hypothetical protein PF003_g15910 [Phytophthora fragariae]KAE8909013.1 hypothetical protein PF003_g6894 [Phytophthora fragariae]KAE9054237.1 hypothetical protein PF010_g32622 [Phytophthora fragariae]